MKKNKEFLAWSAANEIEFLSALNPQDAFFGGRCNVIKLTYDFAEDEKGKYVDFVSLYPTVDFWKPYPVGHPEKILSTGKFSKEWFGFVKCKVVAPRSLYHPVLPVRMKCGDAEKLSFPLCRKCAETKDERVCYHSCQERAFIGTWCTNELHKALEKGYKILKVYEAWHYEKTSCEIFKEYVNSFIKLKIDSSPMNFGEGEEASFRKKVLDKLGVELGELVPNPGKRGISKLCLNNLWGHFGMKLNKPKTVYANSAKEFYEVLLADKVENLSLLFLSEELCQMTFNLKDYFVESIPTNNIGVAAFMKSHARLMLYDVLDVLGERVLGYDTDSAWFVEKEGEDLLQDGIGDSLGELTDELGGGFMTSWCGTEPKSYAYATNDG